jgi:hypothetical protein
MIDEFFNSENSVRLVESTRERLLKGYLLTIMPDDFLQFFKIGVPERVRNKVNIVDGKFGIAHVMVPPKNRLEFIEEFTRVFGMAFQTRRLSELETKSLMIITVLGGEITMFGVKPGQSREDMVEEYIDKVMVQGLENMKLLDRGQLL